ncbi:uncharacterized protein LOC128299580 [Anopheles moucheti]|uniref:uncharacterized protein LOC128299580 n=1 Tax=Anopheles moucheti TaxID=186751 RepID=UPI0022F07191|nr:uncharacterized protein LOC128299580 [Anopheles moucheti]
MKCDEKSKPDKKKKRGTVSVPVLPQINLDAYDLPHVNDSEGDLPQGNDTDSEVNDDTDDVLDTENLTTGVSALRKSRPLWDEKSKSVKKKKRGTVSVPVLPQINLDAYDLPHVNDSEGDLPEGNDTDSEVNDDTDDVLDTENLTTGVSALRKSRPLWDEKSKSVKKKKRGTVSVPVLPQINLDAYDLPHVNDSEGDLPEGNDTDSEVNDDTDDVLDTENLTTGVSALRKSRPLWVLPLYSMLSPEKQQTIE